MKNVEITLTGETGFISHADNIEWADSMEAWKNNPANKAMSKAGDDRTPPWRWIGCLNCDDATKGVVTVPSEYVMSSLMGAGAEVPTGKGRKTFKALSQSGIIPCNLHWPLYTNGRPVKMSDIMQFQKEPLFSEHARGVMDLGFSLFVKRVTIGTAKHIRVRPKFDNWTATGQVTLTDPQITVPVLRSILDIAGRLKGIGDWRPGAPKRPGPFGMFTATVREV